MKKDKQGRQYAKLSDLKVGDTVTVDGDFTCLNPWSQHEVKSDAVGLYLTCKEGEHHLAGQQDDPGDDLTGIYKGKCNGHV